MTMTTKIKDRIEELRKENDADNQKLIELEQRKSLLIQEILVRNGRILELEKLLDETDRKEAD
jgi:hypothetical protein